MSSLFRSEFTSKREHFIKETLINTLSENAREIQFEVKESGKEYLELVEATNSLCTTLEAMFLHGLKDSFVWQTFNALSGDVDHRPEPSFWPPILIFLHKEVIEQVQAHTQIISEIGYCRSWVRSSINESIISSYLNNIRKNNSALNPYYKSSAFLKDLDLVEIASKIIEGIESCVQINLPINSSLLNQWPNYSLQLAGVWALPLKSCPISSGVDVASSISEVINIPTPKPLQTNELFSESISNSPFCRTSNYAEGDLTHKENLDIFLQKVDEMDKIAEEGDPKPKADASESSYKAIISKKRTRCKTTQSSSEILQETEKEQDLVENSSHGNSLTNLMHTSWSSELADENLTNNNSTPISEKANLAYSISSVSLVSSLRSPIDRCSYKTLLKKHEDNRQIDWTNVWAKFVGLQGNESREAGSSSSLDGECITVADFEVVARSVSEKFSIDELQEMVETLCKLAREAGLDAQGFLCKSCNHPLGIGFSPAQVCTFSGNYYCETCMDAEFVSIPARIMYNWDFHRYPVSKRAATFLAEFQYQPFIDFKVLNPDIYKASEEMAELQSLRIRLNFIRAYLYTCCPSSIDELKRLVFMKDYLFEHIHQYSIGDLNLIQQGTLSSQLQKAVNCGEQHILKCGLCSVKGFICEICSSPKVLYPFHINTTYRCQPCGAVFHAGCLNELEPCPKCERRRKRQDLPLFEAIQNMA
ncbi:pleckstrin homology domain-containing family M member 1 [Episyrphus balteatus]|uniref:pleckstrin homology domain-containing family M member 1 n=1 Tax=Episyrphus balteatus TaxID=286459 RepID=UPI00248614C3|nr:pleckstrin homology domain-containing family M member 1 [Episyrphus balteatus]